MQNKFTSLDSNFSFGNFMSTFLLRKYYFCKPYSPFLTKNLNKEPKVEFNYQKDEVELQIEINR